MDALSVILAIGNALALGGVVFLSIQVYRLAKDLISARTDLVVEKSTNAFIVAANETLKNSIDREKAARQLGAPPELSETASTVEAVAGLRGHLRVLAGLSSVPPAGAAPNSDHLPGPVPVHGAAPASAPPPSGKPPTPRAR